jgi:hypothetical protein
MPVDLFFCLYKANDVHVTIIAVKNCTLKTAVDEDLQPNIGGSGFTVVNANRESQNIVIVAMAKLTTIYA